MSNKVFFNSQENKPFLGAYKPQNLSNFVSRKFKNEENFQGFWRNLMK